MNMAVPSGPVSAMLSITLGSFYSNSVRRCVGRDKCGVGVGWVYESERLLRLGRAGWHLTDDFPPWEGEGPTSHGEAEGTR